jgi:hypothetical protein
LLQTLSLTLQKLRRPVSGTLFLQGFNEALHRAGAISLQLVDVQPKYIIDLVL